MGVVRLELKGPDNTLRLRQVKLLGEVDGASLVVSTHQVRPPQTSHQTQASHQTLLTGKPPDTTDRQATRHYRQASHQTLLTGKPPDTTDRQATRHYRQASHQTLQTGEPPDTTDRQATRHY